MTPREHARWARALIKECGGIDEAADNCSVGRSSLSNYQNPNIEHTMPAAVICELETYCGVKIYSRAMFEGGDEAVRARDIREAASEAIEAAADLHKEVRRATADGIVSPNESDVIAQKTERTVRHLREVTALTASQGKGEAA